MRYFFLSPAKQRVGDVTDLRPLEKRGGHAQLPPKTQLLPQRVGVVKEDEVGFAVLGISKVAGKQVLGKKHGGLTLPS